MAEQKLVEVFLATNPFHAHLVKSALEDAGIPAQVTGEMLQGGLGAIPTGWWPNPAVLVAESDVARARKIINEVEGAESSEE